MLDTAVREVTVLAAGGTIAMTQGDGGGAVPHLDADALVEAVPPLREVAGLRARTINTRPSVQLSAAEALDIARSAVTEADGGRGVVVTHARGFFPTRRPNSNWSQASGYLHVASSSHHAPSCCGPRRRSGSSALYAVAIAPLFHTTRRLLGS